MLILHVTATLDSITLCTTTGNLLCNNILTDTVILNTFNKGIFIV